MEQGYQVNNDDNVPIVRARALYDRLVASGEPDERTIYLTRIGHELLKSASELRRWERGGTEPDCIGCWNFGPTLHHDILMPLWEEFAGALSAVPASTQSLIDLVFHGVQLINRVVNILLQPLKAAPLKWLILENNGLRHQGIEFVVEILKANDNLERLSIVNNPNISLPRIRSLVNATVNHPNLSELHFRSCQLGECKDVMEDIVLVFDSAKKVDLGDNDLGSTDTLLSIISSYLARNPPIEFLNMENNNLNDFDAALLADALKTNTNLRVLRLKANSIEQRGIRALSTAVVNSFSMNAVYD